MRRVRARAVNQDGFTLVELIVATTILPVLSGMAIPMGRVTIKRDREPIRLV